MATKTASRRAAAQPKNSIPQTLLRIVNSALDDMKAVNVKVMDVRHLTDITDIVVIASGNSDRHVKSIADRVLQFAKQNDSAPSASKARAKASGCWSISTTSWCT